MKVIRVSKFALVDTTRYMEGDLFLTVTEVGILQNGKIEPMVKQSELKDYVQKKDIKKLINAQLKKVNEND